MLGPLWKLSTLGLWVMLAKMLLIVSFIIACLESAHRSDWVGNPQSTAYGRKFYACYYPVWSNMIPVWNTSRAHQRWCAHSACMLVCSAFQLNTPCWHTPIRYGIKTVFVTFNHTAVHLPSPVTFSPYKVRNKINILCEAPSFINFLDTVFKAQKINIWWIIQLIKIHIFLIDTMNI
jgi:hypothetical protein